MLTRKQKELLDFLKGRLAEDGIPPSFDEMKEALRLRSKSGVHRLILALEERGHIRRLPHRARAIEINTEVTPQSHKNMADVNRSLTAENEKLRAQLSDAATLINALTAYHARNDSPSIRSLGASLPGKAVE